MAYKRSCEVCSLEFEARNANARYCSRRHQQQAYRERRRASSNAGSLASEGVTSESASPGGTLSVEAATLADLKKRQLDTSPVGLAALALARQIDGYGGAVSTDTLSSLASASRVHADLLTKYLAMAADDGDRGDELAERRAQRRREARGG